MARSSHDKSPRGFTINFGCDTFSQPIRSWVRHRFDAETRDEIGTIVLCALANDDEKIDEIVRDARKAANRMFHRNHEPTLLGQVLVMISEGYGVELQNNGKQVRRWLDIERLKQEVEKRFHHGKKLPRYRWNRVREALHWPNRATGAAAASYKRKSKSKSKSKPRRRG